MSMPAARIQVDTVFNIHMHTPGTPLFGLPPDPPPPSPPICLSHPVTGITTALARAVFNLMFGKPPYSVFINGIPAAQCGDGGFHILCCGANTYEIALGSSSVNIEGDRAARMLDTTAHCSMIKMPKPPDFPKGPPKKPIIPAVPIYPGEIASPGMITMGSPTVFIGGFPLPSFTALAMKTLFKGLGLVLKGLGKLAKLAKTKLQTKLGKVSDVAPIKAPEVKAPESPKLSLETPKAPAAPAPPSVIPTKPPEVRSGGPRGYSPLASAPVGSRRAPLNQPKAPSYQPHRNTPTTISDRRYTGHALDRMQDRGIPPSVVDNTIKNGASRIEGKEITYFDPVNKVRVSTDAATGRITDVAYAKGFRSGTPTPSTGGVRTGGEPPKAPSGGEPPKAPSGGEPPKAPSGGEPPSGGGGRGDGPPSSGGEGPSKSPNLDENQKALSDLVKEQTHKGKVPLSKQDADTVLDWAEEYDMGKKGVRASPEDVSGSHWKGPHIHVPESGTTHVPVGKGVKPRDENLKPIDDE